MIFTSKVKLPIPLLAPLNSLILIVDHDLIDTHDNVLLAFCLSQNTLVTLVVLPYPPLFFAHMLGCFHCSISASMRVHLVQVVAITIRSFRFIGDFFDQNKTKVGERSRDDLYG